MLSDKEEALNSLSTLQAVFRLMSAFAPKLGVSLGLPLENGFFANGPLTPLG